MLGPSGGTLTVSGGAARLVVPQGALATTVGLTLRATTQVPLDPHAVARSAWELGPAGLAFTIPATLTLRFDPELAPSGVDEAELRLHRLGGADAWEALSGSVSLGASEATAGIGGAGTYGVRWPGPRGACSTAQDREFDFWLGAWNYQQGSAGGATNDITKEGNGCLVEEHFRDPLGVQGRSVSLFSRVDRRWHQTYIDSQGTRLVLVGSRDGRRMVLDQSATERSVWDPVDTDTIRYFSERTSDGGQTWVSVFDGRYTRR
jgi:hypothetical protein